MSKKKDEVGWVDQWGYPKLIDYSLIKCKEDLIFQSKGWMEDWYILKMDNRVLDLLDNNVLSDKAFRIFLYIGKHLVYNNVSYVNGKEIREVIGIERRTFSNIIKELKDKGFIREDIEEFSPRDQSDRIFLVSPVYFWYGGPTRDKEIMNWYMGR